MANRAAPIPRRLHRQYGREVRPPSAPCGELSSELAELDSVSRGGAMAFWVSLEILCIVANLPTDPKDPGWWQLQIRCQGARWALGSAGAQCFDASEAFRN